MDARAEFLVADMSMHHMLQRVPEHMAQGSGAPGRRTAIVDGRVRLGMSAHDLWVGYFSLGGNGTQGQIDDWLSGATPLPAHDHDVLAQTLNEAFADLGLDHPVAYSDTP